MIFILQFLSQIKQAFSIPGNLRIRPTVSSHFVYPLKDSGILADVIMIMQRIVLKESSGFPRYVLTLDYNFRTSPFFAAKGNQIPDNIDVEFLQHLSAQSNVQCVKLPPTAH